MLSETNGRSVIIGVTEITYIEFPAFGMYFLSSGREIWTSFVDFSHGNLAPFFSTFLFLLNSSAARGGRGGGNYESVHDHTNRMPRRFAFSLASSLSSLSFRERADALAIKTTMMTDAISVALPTGFFALHTRLYAFRCLVRRKPPRPTTSLTFYSNKIYVYSGPMKLCDIIY